MVPNPYRQLRSVPLGGSGGDRGVGWGRGHVFGHGGGGDVGFGSGSNHVCLLVSNRGRKGCMSCWSECDKARIVVLIRL